MHQNLAAILQQLYLNKISFAVFVPAAVLRMVSDSESSLLFNCLLLADLNLTLLLLLLLAFDFSSALQVT